MAETIVPNPREARRQEWPWADAVGVCDDGTSWTADGTISQVEYRELGSAHPPGRGRWLQLDGNRFVILVDDDAEHPNGLWYSPISLLREHIVAAVERERAMIDGGEARAMKMVLLAEIGGRKFARRAWSWRTRDGSDASTEWIDDQPLDWEKYCQAEWPKKPANREAVPGALADFEAALDRGAA